MQIKSMGKPFRVCRMRRRRQQQCRRSSQSTKKRKHTHRTNIWANRRIKKEIEREQKKKSTNAQVENAKDINSLIKYSRVVYTLKTSLIWTSNTYSDLCIVLHTICRRIESSPAVPLLSLCECCGEYELNAWMYEIYAKARRTILFGLNESHQFEWDRIAMPLFLQWASMLEIVNEIESHANDKTNKWNE